MSPRLGGACELTQLCYGDLNSHFTAFQTSLVKAQALPEAAQFCHPFMCHCNPCTLFPLT